MGMAAYGRPVHVDKVRRLVRLSEDGSFELDLSYFSYPHHPTRMHSRRFLALFGEPRDPGSRFAVPGADPAGDPNPPSGSELERSQYYADIAASVQAVTEEIVLRMARHLARSTGLTRLCYAGGVALNSVANHRLLKETPFREVYIQPAAGDAGGALGAALYAHHAVLGRPREFVMDHAFWGQEHGAGETADFLRSTGVAFQTPKDEHDLTDRVTDLVLGGRVVGWLQGKFEWGPRALGHRSILADPRRADMKNRVNLKVKYREPFRPFAPAVTEENVGEYFDLPGGRAVLPNRFMLMVCPVRPEKHSVIPAVTHADGTGRLQVVDAGTNPAFHRLLKRVGQASGVPVLMNTSFNLRGEPIVNSPREAFRTFQASGLDALVLGPHLVIKE
jgi:carbamoyltransferase